MNEIAAVVFSLILIGGCKQDSIIPVDQSNSYLPLAIGNSWIYEFVTNEPSGTEMMSVKSAQISGIVYKDGKRYFRLDGFLFSPDTGSYLIREDEKGNVFSLSGDSENLMFQFSSPTGTVWKTIGRSRDTLDLFVSSRQDSVVTPLGTFRNCITIRPYPPGVYHTIGFALTFAEGVGLVASSSWAEIYYRNTTLKSYSFK